MPTHTEIELKWALTPEAHAALSRRLGEALGAPRLIAQENRFFDTEARDLRQRGMNVRFRLERRDGAERVLLTCKRRLDVVRGTTHTHEEWEEDLAASAWTQVLAGELSAFPLPAHILAELHGAALVPLGGFANERREFTAGEDFLCLDLTTFVDRVDHELEIETSDPARASRTWSARLAEWGIPWEPQLSTKFARYLVRSHIR